MTKTPTWPRAAALVAALAIAITATACSSGGKVNTTAPTTAKPSDPPPTLDAAAAQKAAVLDGFQGYAEAYQHVIASADPDSAELPAHMTGEALSSRKMNVSGLRSAGEGLRLSDVQLSPTVVSLQPDRSVVHVCVTSAAHYFDLKTGRPRGAEPASPSKAGFEDELVPEGGTWKVSRETRLDSACAG